MKISIIDILIILAAIGTTAWACWKGLIGLLWFVGDIVSMTTGWGAGNLTGVGFIVGPIWALRGFAPLLILLVILSLREMKLREQKKTPLISVKTIVAYSLGFIVLYSVVGAIYLYQQNGARQKKAARYRELQQKKINNNPEAALQNAMRYSSQGNQPMAISGFTKAIELKPDFAEAYLRRAQAYLAQRNLDPALADATKAIELDPNLAEAYVVRAGAYDHKDNPAQALLDYAKAIELRPERPGTYISRGTFYNMRRNYDAAIADYTKAIELDPKTSYVYYYRGMVHLDKGDYDSSILDQTKAIEINPERAGAYYALRGRAYYKKGQYHEAVADLSKAIQQIPNDSSAYTQRAYTYYELKEYGKAWEDVRKAESLGKKIDPRFLEALKSLSDRHVPVVDAQ